MDVDVDQPSNAHGDLPPRDRDAKRGSVRF